MIKVKIDGKIVHLPTLKGADGKSAYQYAVEAGFQGTEQDFINLLIDGTDSINAHLTDGAAHDDIRTLIQNLATDFGILSNNTNTQLNQLSGDKVDKSITINNKTLDRDISLNADDVNAVSKLSVGAVNGIAQLDEEGKIPASQLPSYVDDVVEVYVYEVEGELKAYSDEIYQDLITPEKSKIYVDLGETEKTYRWSGTKYVEISSSLAIGETSSTAYAGDKGKETTDKVASILAGDKADDVVRYTNDMATVNALGGIAAGTTFDNMPISTLLTKLLYPYIAPTVSAKASPTNGGTFEKGTAIAVTSIVATVTKKSEAITKVEVFDGSTSLGIKEDGSTGNLTFPVDLSVTENGKKFTVTVTDEANKQVSANTGTFTFVYPYYNGVIDSSNTVDADLVKGLTKVIQSKGNKTVTYTANNQKMVFAYPASYGNLSKIVDPNQFTVTDTFEKLEMNIVCADNASVKYYVYVSKNAVSVDKYNMVFNY